MYTHRQSSVIRGPGQQALTWHSGGFISSRRHPVNFGFKYTFYLAESYANFRRFKMYDGMRRVMLQFRAMYGYTFAYQSSSQAATTGQMRRWLQGQAGSTEAQLQNN